MRRLAALTAIVFVLVLAFLAGRVRAGSDPAQAAAPAPTSQTLPGYGAPGDMGPSADGAGAPGDGSVVPDGDPPVTHAS